MATSLDIEAVIKSAVKTRLAEIITEETAKAVAQIEHRLAGEMDRLALAVLKHYDIMSDQNRIMITVHKPGK